MLRTAFAAMLLAAAAPAAFAQVAAPPAPAATPAASPDARLNAALDAMFDERTQLSPEELTALGIKQRYGELDEVSEAAARQRLEVQERHLARIAASTDRNTLGASGQTSLRTFEYAVAQEREALKWRDHGYVFRANSNPATNLPVFLINQHDVASEADARAYVSRLAAAEKQMGQVADELTRRAEKGITPPTFVFAPSIADTRAVMNGAPFTAGPDTALWGDFKKKVAALKLAPAAEAKLLADGEAALKGPFKRGYDRVIAALTATQGKAKGEDGVWALPDGPAYYAFMLRGSTTTDLTADQIHDLGLAEVARIQKEMEAIKERVGFKGTLQEFFAEVKSNPKYQYPNTAEGKAAYLKDAERYIAQVMKKSPEYFSTLPKAPLEVRAVEPWREATASVAFYNQSTPDGSRPGIFYVNLSDMRQVLKPQVEGIAYHEGAPGHHFQIARAQEDESLPKFRRFDFYGAYAEGWGLYAERLGKEMGFYTDPMSDFGRLSTEIWRAARLVTDTGLHHKRWSKQQAMDYFRQNSLLSERDIQKEVERYLTNPGQATSYKVGQLKILELRDKQKAALGGDFDLRAFHETVLGGGSLPLAILEERVAAFTPAKAAAR